MKGSDRSAHPSTWFTSTAHLHWARPFQQRLLQPALLHVIAAACLLLCHPTHTPPPWPPPPSNTLEGSDYPHNRRRAPGCWWDLLLA
jgi:hypothetical protein